MNRRFYWTWKRGFALVVLGLFFYGQLTPVVASVQEPMTSARSVIFACLSSAEASEFKSVKPAAADDRVASTYAAKPLTDNLTRAMVSCASIAEAPIPHPELRCVGCFRDTY